DLAWIEQRYPKLKGRAWACSCSEIDWLKLGYEGRSQLASASTAWLVQQCAPGRGRCLVVVLVAAAAPVRTRRQSGPDSSAAAAEDSSNADRARGSCAGAIFGKGQAQGSGLP